MQNTTARAGWVRRNPLIRTAVTPATTPDVVSVNGVTIPVEIADTLAGKIRSMYCMAYRDMTGDSSYGTRHMAAWDGDPDGQSGRRSPNWWLRIAAKLITEQIDPLQFVRAQFAMNQTSKQPAPNTFMSDAALDRWRKFQASNQESVRLRISSDMNQIRLHSLPLQTNLNWSENDALAYALSSDQCGASALTKHCLAAHGKFHDIARTFRNRAAVQYLFQQAEYDEAVQSFFEIPADMREEVRAIRSRIAQ